MKHRLLASLFLLCAALVASAAPKNSTRNEKLLKANDPYEGLTESAIAGDAAKIAKAFKSAQSEQAATRALLGGDAAARFDQLFAAASAAQAKKDHVALALQAAELYKLLVSSCDAEALVVPMEVNLLDYAGFRTNALLKAPAPDWPALAATAAEAAANWSKIRARVTDKKLQIGMDHAQAALTSGTAKHDAAATTAAAKQDLDLVDDIEGHFAKQ